MKRLASFLFLACLSLAQLSRDDYRAAYRTWRQTDPNLEREAFQGGDAIARRADRMAEEAAKFVAARQAFLDSVAHDQSQQIAWLESAQPAAPDAISKTDTQIVASETARLTRTMENFAADPDPGIQQLRQALARERAALEALSPSIAQRRKAAEAVNESAAPIEISRGKALEQAMVMSDAIKDLTADTTREAAVWAEYYRKMGEGAQGAAAPITEALPGAPAAVLNNPIPAPPTVTQLPLTRYVGAWTFPSTNALFHGAEPEFIDLLVLEEKGRVKGTAIARFKLPPGSTGDPILRFDFTGDFQPSRRQVFNLVTTDGAKGTIELIPGPAFNLLEVNFQTDPQPGKVHQADVVLVKK